MKPGFALASDNNSLKESFSRTKEVIASAVPAIALAEPTFLGEIALATAIIGAVVLDIYHMSNRGNRKGERNYTGRPDGTPNKYKGMKPDPNDPDRVIFTHPKNGKKIRKKKPNNFDEYWKKKHGKIQ